MLLKNAFRDSVKIEEISRENKAASKRSKRSERFSPDCGPGTVVSLPNYYSTYRIDVVTWVANSSIIYARMSNILQRNHDC
jgi:hypothetical protein